MRHFIITLVLLITATTSWAGDNQKIKNGSVWNYNKLVFEAQVHANGAITFTGMDEGEELAFRLTPSADKKNEYLTSDDPDYDAINPFNDSHKAKHIMRDGQNLICFYDKQGQLLEVLSTLKYELGEEEAQHKWTRQIVGEYTSKHGEPLIICDNGTIKFSANELTYKHIDFNGYLSGIIEIKGGTRLQGTWQINITGDGMKLSKVTGDEYNIIFKPTGEKEVLTWSRKDIPRFQYASEILLNDGQFRRLDKPTLRLLRNEILFHHHYKPSSKDLVEYLKDKEWYSPRPSNDDVFNELSLIEQLNIELIKTEEKKTKRHVLPYVE